MTQHKLKCYKGMCCNVMLHVCACSQGVSTVQILQPSLGDAPSFSSCMSVFLLAGLTGTKPALPLPPPPASPWGDAGAMAGAAPNSPAVEHALSGLVCRASMDLSRLLQAACRTVRCLAARETVPQGNLRRRRYLLPSQQAIGYRCDSLTNSKVTLAISNATNTTPFEGRQAGR